MTDRSWPGVLYEGLSGVRYFSIMNPWIDFVVVFDEDVYPKEKVSAAVNAGMDEYWNRDSEAYGDEVWRALTEAGIRKFAILFHDTENESEEYENEWDFWISEIGKIYPS